VITGDTQANEFLFQGKGKYYSECSTTKKMISFSRTCTVGPGAKLLIQNEDELIKTNAISIDITIIDKNERNHPDMTYDMKDLKYSDEFLEYVYSFAN